MAKLNNNALKHGISAKTLILQNEDPAQFQEILQSYLDEWQPVSPTQMHFVAEMAEARWYLRRISRYQTAMLDMEMDAQAPDFEKRYLTHDEDIRGCSAFCSLADKGKGLNTVHRFHVHYGRVFRLSLNELQKLQNKNPEPKGDNPPQCQPEKDPPAPPPPPHRRHRLRILCVRNLRLAAIVSHSSPDMRLNPPRRGGAPFFLQSS